MLAKLDRSQVGHALAELKPMEKVRALREIEGLKVLDIKRAILQEQALRGIKRAILQEQWNTLVPQRGEQKPPVVDSRGMWQEILQAVKDQLIVRSQGVQDLEAILADLWSLNELDPLRNLHLDLMGLILGILIRSKLTRGSG